MNEKRKGTVSFEAIDEAMDFTSDQITYYLHRETGEVETLFADDDEDPEVRDRIESHFDRYVEIPGYPSHREYELLADFTSSIEEEDIRAQLELALSGRRGVFGRFREIIRRYDDLRRRLHEHRHRAHVEHVRAWLEEEGIELELTVAVLPPPPAREEPPPARGPDLIDLLMLGGKPELIAGAVHRYIELESSEQARSAFVRLAREVVQISGRAWRKRYVKDTSELQVDRFRLVHEGRHVRLFVETPMAIYTRFGG